MWNKYSKEIASTAVSLSILLSGVVVHAQAGMPPVDGQGDEQDARPPMVVQGNPQGRAENHGAPRGRAMGRQEGGRRELRDEGRFASTTLASSTSPEGMMRDRRGDDQDGPEDGPHGELDARHAAFQKDVQKMRDGAKKMMEQRQAQFSQGLKKIKNTAKQQSVQSLNANLQKINADSIGRFSDALDRQDSILADIAAHLSEVQSSGASTTVPLATLQADLAAAQTALATARAAVVAQTAKVYSVTITTEANLKSDVSTTRKSLETDLSAVRDAVKASHEALRKLARELAPANNPQN